MCIRSAIALLVLVSISFQVAISASEKTLEQYLENMPIENKQVLEAFFRYLFDGKQLSLESESF
jgi:hypothetical protein